MGKKLFKLVLLVAVILLAGRWFLQWELRNAVDEAVADMRDYLYVSYDRLVLGFDGVITVRRIQISSPEGEQFSAFINQIEVDMASLPNLVQQRVSRHAPDQLTLKLTGVNANINELAAASEVDVDCTHPERQPAPWMIGVDQDSDITLQYQYQPASQELIVNINLLVRGAYEIGTQARFGDVTPNLRQFGSFDLLRFNFDDIRSVQAWRDYCRNRHNLTDEALTAAHMAGVEKYLAYRGLAMSEPAREAYLRYLDQPERLTFRWLLNTNLDDPQALVNLPQRFRDRLEVELAGTPISPIFVQREPLVDAPVVKKPVAPAAPRGPVEVTFDEARDFVGQRIHVVTGDKTTSGTLISVGESELVVEVVREGVNRFSITFYRSRMDKLLVDPQ